MTHDFLRCSVICNHVPRTQTYFQINKLNRKVEFEGEAKSKNPQSEWCSCYPPTQCCKMSYGWAKTTGIYPDWRLLSRLIIGVPCHAAPAPNTPLNMWPGVFQAATDNGRVIKPARMAAASFN